MENPILFDTDDFVQKAKKLKVKKYKITKAAKQRYNLTHRAKLAGVVIDAKTRTFKVDSLKHADPLTRRRIRKLLKHDFGGELTIDFNE